MNKPESSLVTCRCNNCDGYLEFERARAGERVDCPHCGMETGLYIPTAPAGILVPAQEPTPPASATPPVIGAALPPVIRGRPAGPKTLRRLCTAACVIVVGLLIGLALLENVRQVWIARGIDRDRVQIDRDRVQEYSVDQFYLHLPWTLFIRITNGSPWAIKDIRVTWIYYAKSGTALGRNTHTFYDTIEAGRRKDLRLDYVDPIEQVCKSEAFISGFDFVKPDTATGTKLNRPDPQGERD